MNSEFEPDGPELTPPRKAFSYVGTGMAIVGFLLFISTFFSFAANFGNFDNFEGRAKSNMFRSLTGMVMMIVGAGIATSAKRGFRETNSSSGSFDGDTEQPSPIMIRCPKCNSLSSEFSKFCSQCGAKLV